MDSRNEDLKFYIENKYPLIVLNTNSKVPVEKWRDVENRDRPPEIFSGRNWAVKLGTDYHGKLLCVLDVDPRNRGFESYNALQESHGPLPKTMKIKTGGGGWHEYFVTTKSFTKYKLMPGIELLCVGAYVVAAGSIHPNGTPYSFESQGEPVELPNYILEIAENKHCEDQLLEKKIDTKDPDTIPDGERDSWLTRKAGQMRYVGLDYEDILNGLKKFNLKCVPQKGEGDLARIAKSVMRYLPGKQASALPLIEVVAEKDMPSFSVNIESNVLALTKIYENSYGLIKEISDEILTHAKRPYPHFALASAISILAGVCQGGFLVPNLEKEDTPDGGLSLYQWITSPPGSGKNAYLKGVETYLGAVDHRLLAARMGTSYGLRGSLYCFNSVSVCIDEMQDEMKRLAAIPGSAAAQVLTDFKELFNDLSEIRPVAIKGSRFPAIIKPRLSVFGVGTTGGFKKLLTSDLIGGGLLSRFIHWPEGNIPDFKYSAVEGFDPPANQISALAEFFKVGLTDAGKSQTYEQALENLAKINDPRTPVPKHSPQTIPMFVLSISQDAGLRLKAFRKSQDIVYRKLILAGQAESEVSPASVVARSPQMAGKLAAIAALSRSSTRIEERDANFGVSLASALSDSLRLIIYGSASESPYDAVCRRILSTVQNHKGGLLRKEIMKILGRISSRELNPAILDLVVSGQLYALNSEGKPVDLEDSKTLPRGLRFSIPGQN